VPLEPGIHLGPYEIQSRLGVGGMGEVYRARDGRLERDVAIKILPTHFKAGSRQLAQFEREAKLLASLNHPSICAVYDVGSDHGISFIVMEHLLGETLAARIDRGSIPVNVVLHYAIQIVDALGAAHGAGLVHRDVKPSNIMLTTTGVKLLDFGLAKRQMAAVAAPSPAGTDVVPAPADASSDAGIVGTLHYMAPEQLSGRAVDARSDIWAFGCVVYEMVTGRRAFTGKTLSEVIAAIVTESPLVMTTARDVLPLALEHLVARCLARDPSERWQTTADLARELRSMLPHAKQEPASEPAVAPFTVTPASQRVQPQEPVPLRRPVKPWIAAAAAVLLFGTPAAWLLSRTFFTHAPHLVAVLPFASAGGAADLDYLTEGLADGMVDALARVQQVRTVPSTVILHHKSSDPQKAGQSLGADRIVTGRLEMRSGRLDVDVALVEVASGSELWRDHFSEPLADAPTLQRELTAGILKALGLQSPSQEIALLTLPSQLSGEAYRLLLRGRYASNRPDEGSLRSAIDFFTDAAAKDARLASAFAGVAKCYSALAHFMLAAVRPSDAFPNSKAAAVKALELDPSLADAHVALGFAKSVYERDWQGAGTEYQRAVALQPSDPAPRQWRSEWLMDVGRAEEALDEARTAVRLDPLSAGANLNLGWQLFLARRYPDAIDQLKATTKSSPNFAAARWALGMTLVETGQLDDAISAFKAATSAAPGKPVYLAGLAYANARAHRTAEATQLLGRLRAVSAREYVSPFDLALVALGLDDYPQAFESLRLAVDDHASALASLAVDPRLDALRSDPRFKDLLKRSGL
jgi:eukaryotic-like serine/threonine-protein kinase